MWDSLGIPDIKNTPRNVSDAIIGFGGAQLINLVFGEKWGIFGQNGIPLLLVDNVVSVKFNNKSNITNAPIENGSFASYNKVREPSDISVMMTKASGGVEERSAFLSLLDTFSNSNDLYIIITPEYVYKNYAIQGYDYVREPDNGARMIKVNVHLKEVRLSSIEYLETKSEQGLQTENGNIQAVETKEPLKENQESLLYRLSNKAKNLNFSSFDVKSLFKR